LLIFFRLLLQTFWVDKHRPTGRAGASWSKLFPAYFTGSISLQILMLFFL
jgi:hypothetical protein